MKRRHELDKSKVGTAWDMLCSGMCAETIHEDRTLAIDGGGLVLTSMSSEVLEQVRERVPRYNNCMELVYVFWLMTAQSLGASMISM